MIGTLFKLGVAACLALAALVLSLPFAPESHAGCGESKWRLSLLAASPSELNVFQGTRAVQDVILLLKTELSPGTTPCWFVVWSKMPGVTVDLTGNPSPPGELDTRSWDWFHPGPREQILRVHVSPEARGDGIIEIRQGTNEFDPKIGFVIGTIKVHLIQMPSVVIPLVPRPDLTVSHSEFVRSAERTPAGDSRWRLAFTVRNTGNLAAGPFAVGITTRATGRPVFSELVSGGLGPGENRSFSFTLPDDRPCEFDGDIQVDRFNTVVESNEANNSTRVTHLC